MGYLSSQEFVEFFQSIRSLMDDSVSMPRQHKRIGRPANGSAAKKGGGSTVCALCGRVMKAGSATSEEPVIYSICPSCKGMPHSNPGSTASFC
jgi:hypothetical protein